jgi:hypothetical protein
MSIVGLAGIPGLENMAANPEYGLSSADPPILITPMTIVKFRAIVPAAEF